LARGIAFKGLPLDAFNIRRLLVKSEGGIENEEMDCRMRVVDKVMHVRLHWQHSVVGLFTASDLWVPIHDLELYGVIQHSDQLQCRYDQPG
jgi:hypothetical protein